MLLWINVIFYGEDTIISQNGAHQGEPCGPLLCSVIQPVVAALLSEFLVVYLYDGTIAGSDDSVHQEECGKIGLYINPAKCELFFYSEVDSTVVNQFDEILPGIIIVNELILSGAPISDSAFVNVFNT